MPKFYRLYDVYLNTESPYLVDPVKGETELEPKTWYLLRLFCQKPGKVISRDEIIDSINQGRVVSENAINKLQALWQRIEKHTKRNTSFKKKLEENYQHFDAIVLEHEHAQSHWLGAQIKHLSRFIGRKTLADHECEALLDWIWTRHSMVV